MAARAVIFGCEGPELKDSERRFFADAQPWGFILFARNIETPEQVRRLTAELRASVGRDAPVLIDQEGGRVARMRAPHWREWQPALDQCAGLPDRTMRVRAMRLRYLLIASELQAAGIDVNCAPVLDVMQATSHAVIRNRTYGGEPTEVAEIGRAVADGLLEGGVLPVMKHIPGQGRAALDSHLELPVVSASRAELEAVDFVPFRALADLPVAMTGHVVFDVIDPERCATVSPAVVRLIREEIGFGGLLMTDDLSMKALGGSFGGRVSGALAAGCDMILHCNGKPEEMVELAGAVPVLAGQALTRAERALGLRGAGGGVDAASLDAEFAALQRQAAHA
jgi:beta-N-acetylhexosaminidase